jgi:hypothetical protein
MNKNLFLAENNTIYTAEIQFKQSILLYIMFHAPMGRFQLELIYYFTYFSPSSHLTLACFFPIGLSVLIQHCQQVLKFLLSLDLGSLNH